MPTFSASQQSILKRWVVTCRLLNVKFQYASDPQQRLLLQCAYECMENAGLTELGSDTGFFVGMMGTEYPDVAACCGGDAINSPAMVCVMFA